MKLFQKIRTRIAYQKYLQMLQAIRCGEIRMRDIPFEKRVQIKTVYVVAFGRYRQYGKEENDTVQFVQLLNLLYDDIQKLKSGAGGAVVERFIPTFEELYKSKRYALHRELVANARLGEPKEISRILRNAELLTREGRPIESRTCSL